MLTVVLQEERAASEIDITPEERSNKKQIGQRTKSALR